jgi:hypothetical protein
MRFGMSAAAHLELTEDQYKAWRHHSGSDSGAHAQAFFIPSEDIGAVIFTNGENPISSLARSSACSTPIRCMRRRFQTNPAPFDHLFPERR